MLGVVFIKTAGSISGVVTPNSLSTISTISSTQAWVNRPC